MGDRTKPNDATSFQFPVFVDSYTRCHEDFSYHFETAKQITVKKKKPSSDSVIWIKSRTEEYNLMV